MNSLRLGLILGLYFCATSISVAADGTIRGKVIDRTTKQPLVGATVLLIGTTQGSTTNEAGVFTVEHVKEDVYKIQAMYLGYTPAIKTDVRVVGSKTVYVEVGLMEEPLSGEEIVVTPQAFDAEKISSVSTYTYSREEINRTPGAAGDIFRAIETLPGVSSSGGEFSSFAVRGGSPRDNIILVENIPADRLTHFDGGTEDQIAQGGRFSVFPARVIDEATFYGGGFSAQYGGKHSSLVNMSIKTGNKESFTANGTYDLIGWELNYDGPSYILPTTTVLISARHQDFRQVLELTGQKDLGDPSFTDIIVKTNTEVDQDNTLSLVAIAAPEKFSRNVGHVVESKNAADVFLADLVDDKYLVGANWRLLTSTKSFLRTTVYHKEKNQEFSQGRAYTDLRNGVVPSPDQIPLRPNIFSGNYREQETGMRLLFTTQLSPQLTWIVGADILRLSTRFNQEQNGLDTTYVFDATDFRPDPGQLFLVRRPEDFKVTFDEVQYQTAGYTEFVWTLGSFVISPGARWEWNRFNKKHYVSPRISTAYSVSAETRINGSFGLFYQNPDIITLAVSPLNRTLASERSWHAILGVTRFFGSAWKASIEGYYKTLDDLVVRSDRTSLQYENSGSGWATGVDVSLTRRFIDKFYGQLTLSFAQSKRRDSDLLAYYNSDFNQPVIFNVMAGYEPSKEWSFSAKWKYATGRPADESIIHADVLNDPDRVRYSRQITANNGRRLDPFHTLNFRVDYRKQFGVVALVAFIDILNLYNHLNVNEERFLEMNGTIEKKGFEIIPTLGVKLEI